MARNKDPQKETKERTDGGHRQTLTVSPTRPQLGISCTGPRAVAHYHLEHEIGYVVQPAQDELWHVPRVVNGQLCAALKEFSRSVQRDEIAKRIPGLE